MENDLAAARAGKESFPTDIVSMAVEADWIEFISANGVALRVAFLTPEIARIRYACDGEFQADFSYAIDDLPGHLPIIPEVEETAGGWMLKTMALTLAQ